MALNLRGKHEKTVERAEEEPAGVLTDSEHSHIIERGHPLVHRGPSLGDGAIAREDLDIGGGVAGFQGV